MATAEHGRHGDGPVHGLGSEIEDVGVSMARNTMSGTASAVVQAGVVHGDVHLHPAPTPPVPPVPRQLPAAPGVFAGRQAELAVLSRSAPGRHDAPTTGRGSADPAAGAPVMISTIGGPGGIGKTWFALAWAHHNLDRFPDGQLFVDLHGFSPVEAPTEPAEVIRGFLLALGVQLDGIPPDRDTRAALYRSLVADRRMLIILDNAATAEQVIPLLPGSTTCTVLVTSRRRLNRLITHYNSQHLNLDALALDDSRALLTLRITATRTDAEPEAVDGLLNFCRGYPLALGIVAARAHSDPGLPLTHLAAELNDYGIDALDDDDPTASLPAVLAVSEKTLTEDQRQLFTLLAVADNLNDGHPARYWPGTFNIGPLAAANLLGSPLAAASRLLRSLEEASLIERDGLHRHYKMHDIIRSHAISTADRYLADELRDSALRRLCDYYLHTAYSAYCIMRPAHRDLLGVPEPGTQLHPLRTVDEVLSWLDAESDNLHKAEFTEYAEQRYLLTFVNGWITDLLGFWRWRRSDPVHI